MGGLRDIWTRGEAAIEKGKFVTRNIVLFNAAKLTKASLEFKQICLLVD